MKTSLTYYYFCLIIYGDWDLISVVAFSHHLLKHYLNFKLNKNFNGVVYCYRYLQNTCRRVAHFLPLGFITFNSFLKHVDCW